MGDIDVLGGEGQGFGYPAAGVCEREREGAGRRVGVFGGLEEGRAFGFREVFSVAVVVEELHAVSS